MPIGFWKKEVKITRAGFLGLGVAVFVVSGFASGFFSNYVFPQLVSVPFLNFLNPRLPVIVNRMEQVFVNDNLNVRQLHDRLKASTVSISSYLGPISPAAPGYAAPIAGQGIIVTTDGLIFTTKSIVGRESNALYAATSSGESYQAKLLAFDPKSSLAVLKIEAQALPLIAFGRTAGLAIGDKVIAAGGGLNRYQQPAAVAYVSALPAMVSGGDLVFSSESESERLQVFPAVTDDFRGGGLLGQNGEIVGFVGDEGLLTAEYLQDSLDVFLSKHSLTRAAFGIRYLKITPDSAAFLGLPQTFGFLLVSQGGLPAVKPGGAAEAAGLREGDFIYKMNGEALAAGRGLHGILDVKMPGDVMRIDFYRNGEAMSADVTLKILL